MSEELLHHADDQPDLEQLELDEIAELLEDFGANLSAEELLETARFVKQVGGIDAALELLAQLQQSEAA